MLEKKDLIFIIKFFVIFAILTLILETINFAFLQEFLTSIVAKILALQFEGNKIMIGTNTYIINNFCTGLLSGSIFIAIVFAFRKPEIKIKTLIALLGIIGLFLINILRLLLVLLVGTIDFSLAETTHIISWFLMSAAIIAFWYYFTRKITGEKDLEKLM
jgi:exosortase/archaeosortase family protein